MIPSRLSKYLVRRRYGRFHTRVDPMAIRFLHVSADWPGYVKNWPFLLCPGGWDLADQELPPFREDQMRQLFVERLPYNETDAFRRMVSELEERGETRFPTCRSIEEIREYFASVQRLYESMEAHGCLGPGEAGTGHDGITVRVARAGTLIKCKEGTHRLAIARVLGIPRVPVIVDLIHTGWAKRMVGEPFAPGWQVVDDAVQSLGE